MKAAIAERSGAQRGPRWDHNRTRLDECPPALGRPETRRDAARPSPGGHRPRHASRGRTSLERRSSCLASRSTSATIRPWSPSRLRERPGSFQLDEREPRRARRPRPSRPSRPARSSRRVGPSDRRPPALTPRGAARGLASTRAQVISRRLDLRRDRRVVEGLEPFEAASDLDRVVIPRVGQAVTHQGIRRQFRPQADDPTRPTDLAPQGRQDRSLRPVVGAIDRRVQPEAEADQVDHRQARARPPARRRRRSVLDGRPRAAPARASP